ncbi:ABC transporter permease [Pontibacter virosus]|uniref:Peptide/nickel transport system permease protein n=1 Tax=Pontibacter virosus TaxID=1765052 RepID=A0A2U1AUP8_9BACT|nr:ABC transporter permease [Pontibacter virosus]PVY40148.1 peptide/nickel transport system permease protein [Pontibacter virosus]
MASFVFRRLLLAIPTLWFIASAIFLLSKLMPGAFGSAYLAQQEAGYFSRSDAASREHSYRQFLKTTGQDLPLFYFSITSAALPDTLHRVFPERDRAFLAKLSWQYGDPDAATRFFRSTKTLEASLSETERLQVQEQLYTIYSHKDAAELEQATAGIADQLSTTKLLESHFLESSAQLLASSPGYTYLFPSVQWHGSQNQYHRWLSGLLKGSLGTSLRDGRPVATVLGEAIGNTWWLLLVSVLLATLLAMELAILMVRRSGRIWRSTLLPSLFLLDSIPLFVLAMLLLVLLASPAFLQLFPVYGMGYYSAYDQNWLEQLGQWLQFMALPMICLVLANLPYLTNQFYQAVVAVAGQDYIRTARAKGLSEHRVIRGHMLRNALLPVITLLSDFLPALVAGAVIIETIFAIPGVGRLLIDAVLARDYPIIVGIVVIVAVFRLLSHLVSDLLYALADPRIRTHAT